MNRSVNPCDIRFMALASSYGVLFLANIFIIISLVTNYWREVWDGNVKDDSLEVHFGLHRVCFTTGDRCNNPGNSFEEQNYLPAVHGMVNTAAFLAMIASLVTLISLACDRLGKSYLALMIPSVAVPAIGCLLLMIGVILFAEEVEVETRFLTHYNELRLGWSFGLAASAVGLLGISTALNVCACMIKPTPKFEMY